jgi:hypothetical protein
MSVCCECCVLSGRGLCDGLVTHPEESYRLWCVQRVSSRNPVTQGHDPESGRSATGGGGGGLGCNVMNGTEYFGRHKRVLL